MHAEGHQRMKLQPANAAEISKYADVLRMFPGDLRKMRTGSLFPNEQQGCVNTNAFGGARAGTLVVVGTVALTGERSTVYFSYNATGHTLRCPRSDFTPLLN